MELTSRLLLLCFFVLCFSKVTYGQCLNDDVKTGRDTSVYVSEFAVSLGESSCPNERLNTNTPIIARGARVQFWFRLQGSLSYLRTDTARQPFDIRFFKKEGGTRIFFDAIGVRPVEPQRVAAEAKDNQGRFDWRLFVRKRVFIAPGEYVLTLSQGNSKICAENSSGGLDCELEFMVSP